MARVEIVEVAPRDGLQNEARLLPTEAKLELIERACAAGSRRIEVASFVHPERVPQMADAEAVVAGLEPREDVEFSPSSSTSAATTALLPRVFAR